MLAVLPTRIGSLPSARAAASALAFYVLYVAALFLPALRTGKLLAPGDATGEYIPQFLMPSRAWNPYFLAGFPIEADPQNATFSPLRLVLAPFAANHPLTWNAYIVAIYVLACMCAYAYAYHFTREQVSALVGGLLYGASGLMLRNLAETPIVASAAWTPLVFLAIERLHEGGGARTSVVGGFALAFCLFGGHPQVFFYTGAVASLYVAFRLVFADGSGKRARFLAYATLLFALGAGLSAIQVFPTRELVASSDRTVVPFDQFAGWAWSPMHTFELFVPNAFWGKLSAFQPKCRVPNEAEHAYVGLSALVLSVYALFTRPRNAAVWFWLGVMVFSLVFAYGSNTPLAKLVYQIPGYDKFRVPVRHMQFFSLGACVMGARGARWLTERRRPLLVALPLLAAALGVVTAVWWLGRSDCLVTRSAPTYLACGVLAVLTFAVASRQIWRSHTLSGYGLVLATAGDLGSFGPHLIGLPNIYPYDLDAHLLEPSFFTRAPPETVAVRDAAEATKQRAWPARGAIAWGVEGPPNRSGIWRFRSAVGYFPLAPKSSMDLLHVGPVGAPFGAWWLPEDRALDVSAVRFVTYPRVAPGSGRFVESQLDFHRDEPSFAVPLPEGTLVTGFVLIAFVDDVRGLPLESELAELRFENDGDIRVEPIVLGRDVVDSVDCFGEGLPPTVQAQWSYGAKYGERSCLVTGFRTARRFEARLVDTLRLRWVAPRGILRFKHLALLDARGEATIPIDPLRSAILADSERWSVTDRGDALTVFENRRALKRARWADRSLALSTPEALKALHEGRRPDGISYDPAHSVILPAPLTEPVGEGCDNANTLAWARDDDTKIELDVLATSPCILVLADAYAKGWRAWADDTELGVHRADGAYRAVVVPKGSRHVTFVYDPESRRIGFAVTSLTLVAAAVMVVFPRRRRSRA
jgi:hypothetical protein